MQAQFNVDAFAKAFLSALKKLTASEKVTKETLKALSRSVLEATHETGDISYVNRLIVILTPVNRKVAVLFFKTFTGYSFDEENKVFTKKNKKSFDKAHAAYVKFMEDPNNNIWSWAEREIQVEAKAFELEKVTKYITSTLEKAKGAGLTDRDVMKAILKGGITADCIIDMMDELGFDAVVDENQLPLIGDAVV